MNTHFKNLVKAFESFRYKHDLINVFEDFLYLTAAAFSNSVDKLNFDKREEEYLRRIKKYSKAEAAKFPELLGELVMCFEVGGPNDHLGNLFMELGLGNSAKGQFFTPYPVSQMMARMIVSKEDIDKHIKEKGYFTLCEPTCGAGGMIIATYEAVMELGYNPQVVMRVTSQDIDIKAVLMTFIQTTLLGIDNTVILGDTLALEERDVWRTPSRFLRVFAALNNISGTPISTVEMDEYDHVEEIAQYEQMALAF
ncbi:N-6 DNA methylase [Solibacillus silvestris]